MRGSYSTYPSLYSDRPTNVRNCDSRDNDFNFPCCALRQRCDFFLRFYVDELRLSFVPSLDLLSFLHCTLLIPGSYDSRNLYSTAGENGGRIPHSRDASACCRQSCRATSKKQLTIQLTDITQGCLRVSSAALGLAMPPTKKHAWQDMSGTPWRRT